MPETISALQKCSVCRYSIVDDPRMAEAMGAVIYAIAEIYGDDPRLNDELYQTLEDAAHEAWCNSIDCGIC